MDPSIAVKRKVTVPVGRLGKSGLHIGPGWAVAITGDVRRGSLPLLGASIGVAAEVGEQGVDGPCRWVGYSTFSSSPTVGFLAFSYGI